ncbi:YwmB family TATA-box binding protein [Paenibacillus lemnae]|uniref:Uncharacterized protein n=1 Tax=Paenibacillus lemnae TaxID=1330551 RepID=A0A848M4Q1_PAELE|nr:YwmB family TATA-box binding protein [Paenibacillus lemnae]NMO95586.1 hypothetical protein [Paenibacillus lemnae]
MKFYKVQWVMLTAIIVILGAVFAGFAAAEQAEQHTPPSDELMELYDLTRKNIAAPLYATIKVQGEHEALTSAQLEQMADNIVKQLGWSGLRSEEENGQRTYRVRERMGDVKVSFDVVQSENKSYFKIQIEGQADGTIQRWLEVRDRSLRVLQGQGISAEWNAAFQGNVGSSKPAEELAARVETAYSQMMQVQMLDSYEDKNSSTISRSYQVPSLARKVLSGEEAIHMQIAVHEDYMKNKSTITIGFPVITVEY